MARTRSRTYSSIVVDKKALAVLAKAVPDLPEMDDRFSERRKVAILDIGAVGLQALADHYGANELPQLRTQMLSFKKVMDSPDKASIARLRNLEPAMRAVLGKTAKRWVYAQDAKSGLALAWLVTDVTYREGDNDTPASVRVDLQCYGRGQSRSIGISFDTDDLRGGKTVTEALSSKGYFIQNAMLDAQYEKSLVQYDKWWDTTGVQFRASGVAWGDYDYERTAFGEGGLGEKVVSDYEAAKGERYQEPMATGESWGKGRDDDSDADPEQFDMPVQPFMYCFHLDMHEYYWIHVDHLALYVYNPALKDKLILPDDHRDLVDVLTTEDKVLREDIIAGKAGGTVILAQGDPGTGKTLTAEVYSEVTSKPLYKLHSGQLGTDPETVEKELKAALRRAERWGALMLIDECDVFVRARASDLQQNAIVGVFLRTLEYFNGILFLTTNRGQDIDDAILSRTMAVIQYDKPGEAERLRLWTTLSEQFQVKLSEQLAGKAATEFTNIAGRDIKAFLKLAARWIQVRKERMSIEVLRKAATFRGYKGGS